MSFTSSAGGMCGFGACWLLRFRFFGGTFKNGWLCVCCMFGRGDPEERGLRDIRAGVKEFEGGIEQEQQRLGELFSALKHEILRSLSDSLSADHVRLLRKQVRHVISVARAVRYTELEESFSEEEEVLSHLEDLMEKYPSADISSSGDVQASLRRLRSMVEHQQQLIFRHKEILLHEKQRLVEILSEADELEQEMQQDHSLSDAPHQTIS